jgi:peptide/nickel transport system substrate-binding protein
VRWLTGVLALAAAGCSASAVPATLFYASGAELQSINPLLTVHPLAKQIERYVLFTTLARYDRELEPRPYLARTWTWSLDRRVLTLALRRDLRWNDGVPTTAADVVFTLEAARDPATGYPRAADLECLASVRARDAYTVRLAFCRSQPAFPDVLTDLAIVPAHLLAALPHSAVRRAAFNEHPVGNGPYRLVSHRHNQQWVFVANPDFPSALGGRPEIRRLVIVIVDEAATKLAGLVTGELDVAGIQPMDAALVRRDPALTVVDYPILVTYGLVWNTARPPFNDPRLRRALTLALDRRAMVAAFLYGFGVVADGPVPPWHPRAVAVPHVPFDRAAAGALLDSLGWTVGRDGVRSRNGRPLAFTVLTVGAADNALEQMIQADYRAVGVRMTIRQLELGAFLARATGAARDYDALVTGIPGDLALGYLRALFDSRRLGGPLQYAQYRNPEVDRALDAGDFAAVQRIVARDLPITFLYHARGLQGMSRRLDGVRMDLRGELATLRHWHLDPRLAR